MVSLNEKHEIIELVEKPTEFVSDQAVIGIYYFKDVAVLKNELQYVIDNNIINGGEYQINDGIKRMMANGNIFKTGTVDEWMDCGNKEVTIATNKKMLGFFLLVLGLIICFAVFNYEFFRKYYLVSYIFFYSNWLFNWWNNFVSTFTFYLSCHWIFFPTFR